MFEEDIVFENERQLVAYFEDLSKIENLSELIKNNFLPILDLIEPLIKSFSKNPNQTEKWTEVVEIGTGTLGSIVGKNAGEWLFELTGVGVGTLTAPELIILGVIVGVSTGFLTSEVAKDFLAPLLTSYSFLSAYNKNVINLVKDKVINPVKSLIKNIESAMGVQQQPSNNNEGTKNTEQKNNHSSKGKEIPRPKVTLNAPRKKRHRPERSKKPKPYWQPFPFWPSFWFTLIQNDDPPEEFGPKIPIQNKKPPPGPPPVTPIYQWPFNRNKHNPNANSNTQSNVGGVLFDKSAELVTDIEEIKGAYWDEKLNQLVLVGKRNGIDKNFFLPKMDTDHLSVAMRAIFSNHNLGVSIDQPIGYEKSGAFPPDGAMMPVRYLGNTKDTLFGAIMFEADKLLKNLSMGIDNENREHLSAGVRGFKNELDLSIEQSLRNKKILSRIINYFKGYKNNHKNAWSRMWFVIEKMELQLGVRESRDRSSLVFGKATLKVKAEYSNQQENQGVDPVAKKFSKHFTINYDGFAKEFSILERLRDLAKISAVVKWMKESGKPVDLSLLNNSIIKVPTPDYTPGIRASKELQSIDGNIISTQTFSIYGGVDFDFDFSAVTEDKIPQALRNTASKKKPGESVKKWDFDDNGESLRAIGIPLTDIKGGFHYSYTDYKNLNLNVTRIYDSNNDRKSVFGNGWDFQLPYEIRVMKTGGNDKYLLLKNNSDGSVSKYYFIKEKNLFFLIKEEKQVETKKNGKKHSQISFSYDPNNYITPTGDNGFSFKDIDQTIYYFDSSGKIQKIYFDKNNSNHFSYDSNGNINKINDNNGDSIHFNYNENNYIIIAACPGKLVINYYYDPFGNLIVVKDTNGNNNKYVYGDMGLLTKGLDSNDSVVFRNSYDGLGRKVIKQYDTVVNENGKLIKREYDRAHQLINENDDDGNIISYVYDEQGNLLKSVFTGEDKLDTIFEYDKFDRIKKVIDPLKNTYAYEYNSLGYLTSYTDSDNDPVNLVYDDNDDFLYFKDEEGNAWK